MRAIFFRAGCQGVLRAALFAEVYNAVIHAAWFTGRVRYLSPRRVPKEYAFQTKRTGCRSALAANMLAPNEIGNPPLGPLVAESSRASLSRNLVVVVLQVLCTSRFT
eukprot:1191404-Prorocentrum_minimum.AAC.3